MSGIANPRTVQGWLSGLDTNGPRPDMNGPAALRLLLVTALALTVFISAMSPDQGQAPAGAVGFAFHALHLLPATVLAWWLSRALLRWAPGAGVLSTWGLLVLAGALTGVALAPVSVALEAAFAIRDGALATPIASAADVLTELGSEWRAVPPITAVVWPVMTLVLVAARPAAGAAPRPAAAAHATDEEDDRPDPPAAAAPASSLLARLPAALGRDLVRIEAQEHYVRVVTTRGSTLLLLGISQAAAEAGGDGVDGLRVHRSHWVANRHIGDVAAASVTLTDGSRVPLSRRRAAEVRARWGAQRNSEATGVLPEGRS